MADEVVINGGDRSLEIIESEDLKVSKSIQKIEILEKENNELVHDNEAMKDRITKLQVKLEALESEKAELERDKKSLEAVAARAAELEIEVSRLQHDLITAESDGAEANRETIEMKREIENLKASSIEKGEKLSVLEKERDLLLKKVDEVENEVRGGEKAVVELKKKLENSEKAKIAEINELKKKVKDLESVILEKSDEIEKMKEEKKELEGVKSSLQGLLEEKKLDGINGIHVIENGNKGVFGTKLPWPILAASTGVVVTAGALCYMRSKQK